MKLSKSVIYWNKADVKDWLKNNGFEKYSSLFCDKHNIDGKVLLMLTENDLRYPPISLEILGDIKRLGFAIAELKQENVKLSPSYPLYWKSNSYTAYTADNNLDYSNKSSFEINGINKQCITKNQNGVILSPKSIKMDKTEIKYNGQNLKPEYFKVLMSLLYFFMVSLITACVMAIVNDQVPDMDKYPPLPDFFLSNLPLISWAFQASEVVTSVLAAIFSVILIFHSHRFIIIRRFFALTGTVFLLRCITMMITSLSVPGTHLKCVAETETNIWRKLEKAFWIWSGAGLSIRGVQTCGDYMFSGHTSMLTMLNFFITEYTPRRFYFLHTLSWLLNVFGIFFILAGHEHYSIDIFIAFYITSRLFLYYHTLASHDTISCDTKRTRIWFPMLAYFEGNVRGRVPNTYSYPVTLNNSKKFYLQVLQFLKWRGRRRKRHDSKKLK